MVSHQDEAGVVTTYEYDSMGREAVCVYDRLNRLASVTSTDQATTSYTMMPWTA